MYRRLRNRGQCYGGWRCYDCADVAATREHNRWSSGDQLWMCVLLMETIHRMQGPSSHRVRVTFPSRLLHRNDTLPLLG